MTSAAGYSAAPFRDALPPAARGARRPTRQSVRTQRSRGDRTRAYVTPVAATLLIAVLASNAIPAAAQPSTAAPTGAAAAAAAAAASAAAKAAVPAGSSLVKVSGCSPQPHQPAGRTGLHRLRGGQSRQRLFPDSYGSTYYQPPSNTSGPKLMIAFTNISHKPMHSSSSVCYRTRCSPARCSDVGTFEPGVLVKHKLGLQPQRDDPRQLALRPAADHVRRRYDVAQPAPTQEGQLVQQ